MKALLVSISMCLLLASCATTEQSVSLRKEARLARIEARQIQLQKSVQSGSFLVKMDRLQLPRGGFVQLLPSSNYIIFNNGYVRMRLGYLGRAYDIRPISGINLKGKASEYELISDEAKGTYNLKIKVNDNGEEFDIILWINGEENCDVTVSNIRIETARYSGRLFSNI